MTKICPFCAEQIDDNCQICPECGENLDISAQQTKYESVKNNQKKSPDFILILSVIIVIVVLISGIAVCVCSDVTDDLFRKSDKIETYMSRSDVLDGHNTPMDNVVRKILKLDEYNRSIKNYTDADFSRLLDNLDKYVVSFNDNIDFYYDAFQEERDVYIGELRLTPVVKRTRDEYGDNVVIEDVKITKPSLPILHIVYAGEGYYCAEPDYIYLNEVYSQRLSQAYKDYLALKIKEQKTKNGYSYIGDGAISVSSKDLRKFIMMWTDFSKKYPDFKKDEIKQYILVYTTDLLWNTYGTFDDNKLNPETKKEMEYLLKHLDKDTKAYQLIDKYYKILKKYDFKFSNEYEETYHRDFDDIKCSYT